MSLQESIKNKKISRNKSVVEDSPISRKKIRTNVLKSAEKKKKNLVNNDPNFSLDFDDSTNIFNFNSDSENNTNKTIKRRNTISYTKKETQNFRNQNRFKTLKYSKRKATIRNHVLITRNKSPNRKITPEILQENLSKGQISFKDNEERISYLMNLNPFYASFHNSERHSESIIRTISPSYKGQVINKNKIIFRYGEEINDFYIVHKGKVNLYFPFTETMNLNMDEYYIYLLRLRRYNEI